jgi:hypothetical protein
MSKLNSLSRKKVSFVLALLIAVSLFLLIHLNASNFHRVSNLLLIRNYSDVHNGYEELNAYETLYKGIFDKASVLKGNEKINTFFVVTSDEDTMSHRANVASSTKFDQYKLGHLFQLLYLNRAFLADTHLINKTEFLDKTINRTTKFSSDVVNKTRTYEPIDRYLKTQNIDSLFLTFGIEYNNIKQLDKFESDVKPNLDPECIFHRETVKNEALSQNKNMIAGFYIRCSKLVVHLPIFYTRGAFLWISNDNFDESYPKLFGDKPRSMNKYVEL